ncbi:MAG: formylglycine-generating enzyme family protein [Planctomycetota bacterium]|jgi:formylglycine-generating enzyme required for sulfatase activity
MPGKTIKLTVMLLWAGLCLAECPPPDITGDCLVNFDDFALMAAYWLAGDPCDPRFPQDMVIIPAGTFEMGDSLDEGYPSELPAHTVTLNSFLMARFEITNRQYCDYLNSALSQGQIRVTGGVVYMAGSQAFPYCDTHTADPDSQIDYNDVTETFTVRTKSARDMSNDPMVQVSWYGAVAYCNWRSREEGRELCYNLSNWTCYFWKNGYRLPTEAEWEYAARGGLSRMRFPWGDTISHSRANYYSDSGYFYDISPTRGFHADWEDGETPYTAPVGSFPANGHGLYDMAGNVWEWCNDFYDPSYYNKSPSDNPKGPLTSGKHVLRGGAWSYDADFCRLAYRGNYWPEYRYNYFGFRIVLNRQ